MSRQHAAALPGLDEREHVEALQGGRLLRKRASETSSHEHMILTKMAGKFTMM